MSWVGSGQGIEGEKKIGFSCHVPLVKVSGYFYRYQLVRPENSWMGTGCEVARGKINIVLESNLVQCGQCEEKKKKAQMENPSPGQLTPQKLWGPCAQMSPCTRQRPLCGWAAASLVGAAWAAEHSVVLQALQVAIILGEQRNWEVEKNQDQQAVTLSPYLTIQIYFPAMVFRCSWMGPLECGRCLGAAFKLRSLSNPASLSTSVSAFVITTEGS